MFSLPMGCPGSAGGAPLHEGRVRPATLKGYKRVLLDFLSWARVTGMVISDPESLDDACVVYAELRRVGRSAFSKLLAAILFFMPRMHGHLWAARATLIGWSRLEPTQHTTPMLRVFVLALAVRLSAMGYPELGSGVLLGHTLLLRPSELIGLKVSDITLPEHAPTTGASRLFVSLGPTPWGTKVNRRQVVSTVDVFAAAAARALVRRATAAGRVQLLPACYETFRRRFRDACAALGWGASGFAPHSLRAGGATQMLMNGRPFEDIQAAGRWAAAQSCKVYLDGVYALAAATTAQARPFLPLLSLRTLPPELGSVA